jgi:hypothetical protein
VGKGVREENVYFDGAGASVGSKLFFSLYQIPFSRARMYIDCTSTLYNVVYSCVRS